ncbi:MAG: hypothetical protein WDN06_06015 [Asticcacaulis sp.]
MIGRVTEGDCDEKNAKGIPGIRILLDNGAYVVTDRDGLYHFEGVRKGRHVVKLDTHAFISAFEPVVCQDDTRWAGSTTSRFVEGEGGTLQRVDFRLKRTGKTAEVTQDDLPPVAAGDVAAGARGNWLIDQTPASAGCSRTKTTIRARPPARRHQARAGPAHRPDRQRPDPRSARLRRHRPDRQGPAKGRRPSACGPACR